MAGSTTSNNNSKDDDEENQLRNSMNKEDAAEIMIEREIPLIPRNNCVVKMLGQHKVSKLLEWSQSVKEDTHGINLKTKHEKIMFEKFYRVRNDFSKNITQKIRELQTNENVDDYIKPFNRIKYEIENIVKNRYWYAIQSNRLFIELREIISSNNKRLEVEEIEWLEGIYNQYVENGVEYNNHLDQISQRALKDMEFQQKMRRMSTGELQHRNTHLWGNMVIKSRNEKIPSVRGFSLGRAESVKLSKSSQSKPIEEGGEEEEGIVMKTFQSSRRVVPKKEEIELIVEEKNDEPVEMEEKPDEICRNVLDDIILEIIKSHGSPK